MDLSNACHGFMNALHVVDALIATGQARYGLVVTGEQPSHVARETLRQIRRIRSRKRFMSLIGGLSVGDAGAAMLVGPRRGPDEGFAGFMLASDGRHHDLCVLRKGKTVYGHMHMREIVREIVDLHAKLYPRTLERLGWQPGLIDSFVHHQVGKRPFRMHAEYAGIGLDIMPNTVGHLGNITSATIPVNLHLLENAGTLADGARVFVAGTGSGLSVSQAGLLWKAA
jgi:3-oxoacyl-[acyl-carrier-protein] synthase-3